ncbi:MAG: hypothetical protein NZM42_11535 [Gemmatales bacterium]|nr:hypothetical protein [Gemmatales bacterium]MDW8224092.1 hypothetical protein [Gemmatales bacterium]
MDIQIGLTDNLSNTCYAPLAALMAHYQRKEVFAPLHQVQMPMRQRDFSPASKLTQILLSMLAGCDTLAEVNPRLRQEHVLAAVLGLPRLADPSSLSRTLDALTLKNLDELRRSLECIWRPFSRVHGRDWRRYLWLDFDLSGLPCGPRAEASQKGYFAGKKTFAEGS